ncbi:PA2778 family cysteine peptidase [Thiogranum longum]|nr:PA2778 family cysteine peptidase [Thiogranum longum]
MSPRGASLPADVAHTLPRAVQLDDTPFFPQTAYQCGPAALATVLQAQGISTTPDDLSRGVYLPARKGSLQVEMIAAARRLQALPYVLEPSFAALLQELAAGNPVLVLQNLGLSVLPRWHYAVVVGYDLDRQVLVLRSGTLKQRITPVAVFLRTWRRSGQWALVVLPVGKIPVTANPATYLRTAHAFEETGMVEQAAAAYRAATKRWPQEASVWMVSGNMAFATRHTDEAVADFLTATRLAPDDPVAWNNLAYALRDKGCLVEARTAIQCALHISPDDKNLRDSRKDMSDGAERKGKPGHCEPVNCTESSLY